MKILAIADKEDPRIWDRYKPEILREADLVLSAGDLDPHYLSYCVTYSNAPVLYIHGNHDEKYDQTPPEGCICIEDDLVIYQGLRILGLGGSMRYRRGTHQYTEKQMQWRIRRLWLKIRSCGGFDILLTHAPLHGLNDLDTLPHRGFNCFRKLLDRWQPRYFIHGHVHREYGVNIPQRCMYGSTTVINAYDYCIIEIPDEEIGK